MRRIGATTRVAPTAGNVRGRRASEMIREEMMRKRSAGVTIWGLHVAATLAFAAFAPPVAAQSPDTALVNGKIITLDERSAIAEALAVRDGTIMAVGRSADIRDLAGP